MNYKCNTLHCASTSSFSSCFHMCIMTSGGSNPFFEYLQKWFHLWLVLQRAFSRVQGMSFGNLCSELTFHDLIMLTKSYEYTGYTREPPQTTEAFQTKAYFHKEYFSHFKKCTIFQKKISEYRDFLYLCVQFPF